MRGYQFLTVMIFDLAWACLLPVRSEGMNRISHEPAGIHRIPRSRLNLRMDLTLASPEEWARRVQALNIGAVTISGGTDSGLSVFRQSLAELDHHAVRIYLDAADGSFSAPLDDGLYLPKVSTLLRIADTALLSDFSRALCHDYSRRGVKGTMAPLFEIRSEGPRSRFAPAGMEKIRGLNLQAVMQLASEPIMSQADLRLYIPESQAGMPDSLQIERLGLSRHSPELAAAWPVFNRPSSRLIIRQLPLSSLGQVQGGLLDAYDELAGFQGSLLADLRSILIHDPQSGSPGLLNLLLDAGVDEILLDWDHLQQYLSDLAGFEDDDILRNKGTQNGPDHRMPGFSTDVMEPVEYVEDLPSVCYRIYRQSIDVRISRSELVPVRRLENLFFASLTIDPGVATPFQESLENFAPFVHFTLGDALYSPVRRMSLLENLSTFDYVIVNLGDPGISRIDFRLRDFIFALNLRCKLLLVAYGEVFDPDQFGGIPAIVHLAEEYDLTQRMAAQIIFGAWPLRRLSVSRRGEASYRVDERQSRPARLSFSTPELQGMDSGVLSRIDSLALRIIDMRITPGCQILVARNGNVIYNKSFGYISYDNQVPVDNRSLYDLASLTKVAATTQMLMCLYGEGKFGLDQTLGDYLPETIGTGKDKLRIRDVLMHQAGFQPFLPLWRKTSGSSGESHVEWYATEDRWNYSMEVAEGMYAMPSLRDSVWMWTLRSPLLKKTNPRLPYTYRYSDLGMFAMYKLAERLAGKPMEEFLDSAFYLPMGLGNLTFNPLCRVSTDRVSPTEYDRDFRQKMLWGTVHDPMAAMNGGVAGHAGLFGNAHDVAAMLYMNLRGGNYGGREYLSDTVLARFTAQQSAANRRGLGWDRAGNDNGTRPASQYASPETFGHLGFTGTAAWADPTLDLILVFLSNRVHTSARNNKLNDLNVRKKVHDLVYESIMSYEHRKAPVP